MPVCQNCHQKWPYSKAFRRIMWFNGGMECPHCGKKQYVTPNSRKRSASLTGVVSAVIIFGALLLDLSLPGMMILALSVFIISIFVLPSAVRLSNEDKPLW